MNAKLSFFALLALTAATPAVAQSHISEKILTKMSNWDIIATSIKGQHFYCAAETNNRQVSLRVAMRDGRWQMGVPFYSKGNPTGSIKLPRSQEEVLSFTADGDGWAHVEATSLLPTLRQDQSVSITLDRGPQTWSLSGASTAFTKVEECDRNRGRVGSAQMHNMPKGNNTTQPQWGQQTQMQPLAPLTPKTGIANNGHANTRAQSPWGQKPAVKGPMQLMPQTGTLNQAPTQTMQSNNADVSAGQEQTYLSNLNGWTIIRGRMDDRTPYCLAEKRFGQASLRLLFDKRDWLVGVQHQGNGKFYGGLAVDGQSDAVEWLGLPSGWSVALVAEAFMTHDVARGSNLRVDLSGRNYNFQLAGSGAAIGKIRECTNRMR